MQHFFNCEVAKRYGLAEAVFLSSLHFWMLHNKANGRHYFEDKEFPGVWRHWTYNSSRALMELFPYWSQDQIKRLIRKLRDNGLIHTGNYNKMENDKTLWYALSDEVIEVFGMGETAQGQCETAPGRCESAQPLPDNIPDINPDNNIPPIVPQGKKTKKKREEVEPLPVPEEIIPQWNAWVDMREERKKPLTAYAHNLALGKLEKLAPGDFERQRQILDKSTVGCWTDLYQLKQDRQESTSQSDNIFFEMLREEGKL